MAELKDEIEHLKKDIHDVKDELNAVEEDMKLNIAGVLSKKFMFSPLTPLMAIVIMIFGLIAVFFTPREENPQIDVPAANVIVMYPGASSQEVQHIIIEPLERILKEMTEVDNIYSMAQNGVGVVTVKFNIGEHKEMSLLKLYDRVAQNIDLLPKGVLPPIFKPIDIDEVPILTFAISSDKYSDEQLYRIAQRVLTPISNVDNVSRVGILGGHKKQFNILVDPNKLSAYNLSINQLMQALNRSNSAGNLGAFEGDKYSIPIEFYGFIKSKYEIDNIIIAIHKGRAIYVKDIATIEDGVDLEKYETYFTAGKAYEEPLTFEKNKRVNQVTVFVAKKRGSNAVFVSEDVLKRVEQIKKYLPQGVDLVLTRDDGAKANEAVNELIYHLVISIIIIVILLIFMLGTREAIIVSIAIPLVLSITLFVGMLFDQTINRITLFALILSLGLLVDDAIVVIENIHRHFLGKVKDRVKTVIFATNEIGNPTSLATLTVMFAFFPMAFVSGMMGPYMAPIPFNVPVAMLASLFIAYIFTPWAAYRFLPQHKNHSNGNSHNHSDNNQKGIIFKTYKSIFDAMFEFRYKRYIFMFIVIIAFFGSLALPMLQIVEFKMLPGANKNTFNITIDLPTASSIQSTKKVTTCVESKLQEESIIKDFESFIGIGGVIDFNGLLRGSSLKKGENLAEIRVNLTDFHKRDESSIDFVSRIRDDIQECESIANANIKLVEDPPGPPVLATLLMEIHGINQNGMLELSEKIKGLYKETEGVVDIDIVADEPIVKYVIEPDLKKSQLAGISPEQITNALHIGLTGAFAGVVHIPNEREQVKIFIRFEKDYRNSPKDLERIQLMSQTSGKLIPLSEIAQIKEVKKDALITGKDLSQLVMVTAEMDKRGSLYALLDIFFELKDNGLEGYTIEYDGNPRLNLVVTDNKSGEVYNLIWSGEWEITFDTFRDLGSAFAVSVLIIYILMIAYYGNFRVPGVVLAAIPLTFIGVLPGHAIMSMFTPTYFTATSMIGFIALAGVVVRNSLLLVDFVDDLLKQGRNLNEAIIEAGATRFTPIILTALAIILASFVIIFDPVWQGLAVALVFGVTASTLLTLLVVPLLYWRYLKNRELKENKNSKNGLQEVKEF